MSDNKELNPEELEKVTGGAYAGYTSLEELKFKRSIGEWVDIHNGTFGAYQLTIGSYIRKLGYTYIPDCGFYEPCYYLEAAKGGEHNWDGWYGECTVCGPKQKTWAHARVKSPVVEL